MRGVVAACGRALAAALLLVTGALAAVAAGLVALALSGQRLALPPALVARIETRLAADLVPGLAPGARLRLGGLDVWLEDGRQPRLALREVTLRAADGGRIAALPELAVGLAAPALLRGELRPELLTLADAEVTLRRSADGRLDLALGGGMSGLAASGSAAELLDGLDRLLAAGPLAQVGRIAAEGLILRLDDAVTGRSWRLTDGRVDITQGRSATTLAVAAALEVPPEARPEGRAPVARLWFRTERASSAAVLHAAVENLAAGALADGLPALAPLARVAAPVSAEVRLAMEADGAIGAVFGRLALGPGAYRPGAGAPPLPLDGAVLALHRAPGSSRIDLTEIALEGPTLHLRGSGWAYPPDAAGGGGAVAQLRLAEIGGELAGLFAAPVTFRDALADLRLRFDPFTLEIGQLSARVPATGADGTPRLELRGRLAARDGGWEVALDAAVDAIPAADVIALWPATAAPEARAWAAANIRAGTLREVRASLRAAPGADPVLALRHSFEGAEVAILPTLPPIEAGAGYATLEGRSFLVALERGRLEPGAGGPIELGRSVFRIPDVAVRPPAAEVELRAAASAEAAMALLARPPFAVRGPAGGPVQPGEGRVEATAQIALPLLRSLTAAEVAFTLAGRIEGLRSTTLVPGQVLAADALDLAAEAGGAVRVSGRARLGEVPLEGAWSRPLGPGPSLVEGTVELSARFAQTFGLPFAPGALEGAAPATFRLDLPPGGAPRFRLASALVGLGLRLPELGWAKPPAARGRLEAEGRLGPQPAVERLSLEAPGLLAEGTVRVEPGGGLAAARFSRVRLAGWLDGPVELTGRGPGAPVGVRVAGGWIDLRGAPPARAGAPAAAGRARAPVELALDRLVLSDSIALTDFRASLTSGAGLSGSFSGRVNGAAPVEGRVVPSGGRTAVRIAAADAGAVARAAGLFRRAEGGTMDLVLVPRADGSGHDGDLRVTGPLRLREAPALAALLNAVSVIGLLEQLGGAGITFAEAEARFRLAPGGIEITRASAVGPSIGVSLEGVMDTAAGRVDLRGVLTPLYMLNAAGGLFARRGEGLFGFTFRIAGPAAAPRVEVNPLSVLTPGMFRELFRVPPPALSP